MRIYKLFLLVVIVASCSTTKFTTTNLQDLVSFEEDAVVYALPQTKVQVKVLASKTVFEPGIYSKYAKQMLDIDGAKETSSTSWQIVSANIDYTAVPDPDHYYSLKNTDCKLLSKESFVPGDYGLIAIPENHPNISCSNSNIKDVSNQSVWNSGVNKSINLDNIYRLKENGNNNVMQKIVPIWNTTIAENTDKEKAQTVADLIFKLRLKKFQVLTGKHSIYPDGLALNSAISELDELETEYLSLFIGNYSFDTVEKVFNVIPENNKKLQRYTLFHFSTEKGIISTNQGSQEETSVVMEIKDIDSNSNLNNLDLPESVKSNHLIYRMPDKALVKILYGSHTILEVETPMYQIGVLMPLYLQ